MTNRTEMSIDPNMWIEIGNGFSACIKQSAGGNWEVWVLTDNDHQFISAQNLPTEQEAAANLTGVVTRIYGDERIYTPIREAP